MSTHSRKFLLSLAIIITLALSWTVKQTQAQSVRLFAYNTITGAANGAVLGTATMSLANDYKNTDPLRFGVGLGTLYGLGIGVYDVSNADNGSQFYVSGTFNDASTTSLIVLLDTFYGALTGSVVGTAITLMTNDPIVDGLRVGSGIGAWAGFGFGLFDVFALNKGSGSFAGVHQNQAEGLVSISNDRSASVGFISPAIHQTTELGADQVKRTADVGLNVINLNINL